MYKVISASILGLFIIINIISLVQTKSQCLNPMIIQEYSINDEIISERNDIYPYVGFLRRNVTVDTVKVGNSLSLFDTRGKLINCVNYTHFIEISPEPIEGYIFSVTYYQDDVLLVSVQRDEVRIFPTYLNNFDFIFIDLDFEPIGISPIAVDTSHSEFYPGSTIYPHGIILLDKNLVLMLVDESVKVDIKEYNPELDIPDFKIHTTSFLVANRKTNEISHARSTFYTLMNLDNWVDWLSDDNKRLIDAGDKFIEMVHIGSINEVKGDHWDYSLRGARTFLISSHHMDTIDLFVWNFEYDEDIQIIWRFPHLSAPIALESWKKRWEIEGDPLYGPSHAHDANVFNEPEGHFLIHDNGDNHNFINIENDRLCPMSRAAEYKIEMHKGGPNYHKATLVWSYPPVEDYPPISEPYDPKAFVGRFSDIERPCDKFWYHFPYQFFGGTVRRFENSDLIQYSRFSIDAVINSLEFTDFEYDSQFNVIIDKVTNKEVLYWNNTIGGFSSFKLATKIPLDAYLF